MTTQSRGGTTPPRPQPRPGPVKVLERVKAILETACERDGQGQNLSETARRKSYRAEINRALAEIARHDSRRST